MNDTLRHKLFRAGVYPEKYPVLWAMAAPRINPPNPNITQ